MSYLDWVQKPVSNSFANANPANLAKDGQENRATLATLATLALANSIFPEILSENTLPKESGFLSTKSEDYELPEAAMQSIDLW